MHALTTIPAKYIILVFTGITLVSMSIGIIPIEVMVLLAGFGVLLYFYPRLIQNEKYIKATCVWLGVVLFGLAIGLYRPDNFNYPLILDAVILHDKGNEYSLYFNTGKTIAGYMALCFLFILPALGKPYILLTTTRIVAVAVIPLAVLLLAYFSLDLNFYFKNLNYILLFGAINLLATCVSEEAFMRLIFQKEIGRLLGVYCRKPLVGESISLLLTTLLFTGTHIGPSLDITIVYAIAGFSYGLIYVLTKSIWYSIFCHFAVNILHFSLLTYPII